MYALLPKLPAELTDMVIDHLHNDEETLFATSLVCRSWVPRSRVHLFKHVGVTGGFDELLRFLQGTPQIRGYVRHLVMQGSSLCVSKDEYTPRPQATLSPHLLAEILAQLPRLSTVQLHDVSFHEHYPSRLLPYPLHTLEELTLMNVGSVWDTTDDVLSVLGLFSEIKYLHLNSIAQVVNAPLRHPPIAPAHIRVHALKFEDVPSDIYFEVIRGTRSDGALRCVEAECTSLEDAEALSALLADAGSALEHLALDLTQCFRLDYYPEDSEETFIPDPRTISEQLAKGLAACPRLRSLDIAVCFDFPAHETGPATHSAWECLAGLLARVPAGVQDLTIQLSSELWDVSLENLRLDWQPVRAALKRLAGLKSVTVATMPMSEWHFSAEEREEVEKSLEAWHERGVLHVGF